MITPEMIRSWEDKVNNTSSNKFINLTLDDRKIILNLLPDVSNLDTVNELDPPLEESEYVAIRRFGAILYYMLQKRKTNNRNRAYTRPIR